MEMSYTPLSNDWHFRQDNALLGIFVLYETEMVVLIEHSCEGASLKNEFIIEDLNKLLVTSHDSHKVTFTYPWPDYEIWSVSLQGKDKLLITLKRKIDYE